MCAYLHSFNVGALVWLTNHYRRLFCANLISFTSNLCYDIYLHVCNTRLYLHDNADDGVSGAADQCVVHRLTDGDKMQGKRHPDLRMCDLSEKDISKTDLIGVVMQKTNAANTSFVKSRLCGGVLKRKLIWLHLP